MNFCGTITSRQNKKIISACSLADKKHRDEEGKFCFEGIKLFREALRAGAEITEVFATSEALGKYRDDLEKSNADVYEVEPSVYEKLTAENAPQGIFAIARQLRTEENHTGLYILLDGVADPGNLGTIIRCADAFGAGKIYLGDGCADLYNPKTVRAAMGSIFRVPAQRGALIPKIKALKDGGCKVYAAMLDESSVSAEALEKGGDIAFVIGNEGNGISDSVRAACTGSVIIPMKKDGAESLNAAVAAAILMWEHKRIY